MVMIYHMHTMHREYSGGQWKIGRKRWTEPRGTERDSSGASCAQSLSFYASRFWRCARTEDCLRVGIVKLWGTEHQTVATHYRDSFEDIIRNRVCVPVAGIQIRQGRAFIDDFELEGVGDGLSADGGSKT